MHHRDATVQPPDSMTASHQASVSCLSPARVQSACCLFTQNTAPCCVQVCVDRWRDHVGLLLPDRLHHVSGRCGWYCELLPAQRQLLPDRLRGHELPRHHHVRLRRPRRLAGNPGVDAWPTLVSGLRPVSGRLCAESRAMQHVESVKLCLLSICSHSLASAFGSFVCARARLA